MKFQLKSSYKSASPELLWESMVAALREKSEVHSVSQGMAYQIQSVSDRKIEVRSHRNVPQPEVFDKNEVMPLLTFAKTADVINTSTIKDFLKGTGSSLYAKHSPMLAFLYDSGLIEPKN